MAKADFPALLPPGIHTHTLATIESLAVLPFPDDLRRVVLFEHLAKWLQSVQSINISARMWIDGSFLTQKPGPDDIDCVVWHPEFKGAPTPDEIQSAKSLFDKPTARTLFNLDLYHEQPASDEVVHREAYWKGFFGYCHDRVTAKGFVEIQI